MGRSRIELFDADSTPAVPRADGDLEVTRIRQALAEHRLVLHAQPIVELDTGSIINHDLLLRMRGSDGHLIAPQAFLPTAERCGLIRDIDEWVIKRAIGVVARGRRVGSTCPRPPSAIPACST